MITNAIKCDCSIKYEKLLKELHARLKEEHEADKEKALKDFSDKVSICCD